MPHNNRNHSSPNANNNTNTSNVSGNSNNASVAQSSVPTQSSAIQNASQLPDVDKTAMCEYLELVQSEYSIERGKKESFENIENWINEVTVYTGKEVVMICLGNNNDLKKGIDKKEIYEFQKKTGLEIINVSAKTGDGVEEAFKHIIELLIKKNLEAKENMDDDHAKINLTEGNNNKNKNKAFDNRDEGCC